MWRHILQVFQQSSFIVQVQDWPVCSPDLSLQMCGTLWRTAETSDCWSTKVIYQSTTFNNNIHYLWERGLFLIFFLKWLVSCCSEFSLSIFTTVLARLRAAGSSVSRTICQTFEAAKTDRFYGTSQNTASVVVLCSPHVSKAKQSTVSGCWNSSERRHRLHICFPTRSRVWDVSCTAWLFPFLRNPGTYNLICHSTLCTICSFMRWGSERVLLARATRCWHATPLHVLGGFPEPRPRKKNRVNAGSRNKYQCCAAWCRSTDTPD